MRRTPYHYTYRHHRRMGPPHGFFGPLLLLLLCAAVLAGSSVIAVLAALGVIVVLLAPLLLAGVAVLAFTVALRRRRKLLAWQQRRSGSKTQPPAPVARHHGGPAQDWASSKARFARLRHEYGQFECDPLAVLRLPALADVTVPATGRFVDAFAEAQALDTDVQPPPDHRVRFATAVDRAWRAWQAAREAAERIRLAGIPTQERATVDRAIKLLTMARDSQHDAERIAAYSRARAELAKLDRSGMLRLPPAAAAALDAAARGQLPPAPSSAS